MSAVVYHRLLDDCIRMDGMKGMLDRVIPRPERTRRMRSLELFKARVSHVGSPVAWRAW